MIVRATNRHQEWIQELVNSFATSPVALQNFREPNIAAFVEDEQHHFCLAAYFQGRLSGDTADRPLMQLQWLVPAHRDIREALKRLLIVTLNDLYDRVPEARTAFAFARGLDDEARRFYQAEFGADYDAQKRVLSMRTLHDAKKRGDTLVR